ncbi:Glycerate kinase [Desulfurella amilsii]|uniref:Glycerate kinase n=1 Tax=Desulfurella amilsii TaxID=1562698 RepID=A0A1X4XYJ3_9BACT|nr:glycerate kinase [Desulfurella amilsii]OSS42606.1 Glycerate kinase [Desulfurella amilsii]
MKILVSINAFKGAISTVLATDTTAQELLGFDFSVEKSYIADGGDGTVEVAATMGANLKYYDTYDPLMRPIKAPIAWFEKIAVIEMAKASGLALIKQEEKNPLKTTSFGTGVLIKKAIEEGAEEIILGIGGSATVDGGIGILEALNFKFLDAKGNPSWMGGESLQNIRTIVKSPINFPKITIASDVTNPLLGPNGASKVFGPQKGADPQMVEFLDDALAHFNDITKKYFNIDIADAQGAGAAGGIGGFASVYLNAQLKPGAELFMDLGNFNEKASESDVLITGEGALDKQTSCGKAPYRVAKRFKSINKNGLTIALSGSVLDRNTYEDAIDVALSIIHRPLSIKESIESTQSLLRLTTREVAKILLWSQAHNEFKVN